MNVFHGSSRSALPVFGLALLLGLTAGLPAQISGNFTIDSSLPSSSTNFTSFAQAVAALQNQAPATSVTFTVFPGSGPYQGFQITAPIAGASASDPIVFQAAPGTTPVLDSPAAGGTEIIRLGPATVGPGGPIGIVLEGLEITGAPQSAGVMAVGAQDLVLRGCRIRDCGSGVSLMACATSTLEANEIYNCGTTIAAPGVGTVAAPISVTHGSSMISVVRNRVRDCVRKGIHIAGPAGQDSPSVTVANNFVRSVAAGGAAGAGIEVQSATGAVVAFNSVSMPATSGDPGVLLSSAPGALLAEISNNVVRHQGTGSCIALLSTPLALTLPAILDYNLYDAGFLGTVAETTTNSFASLASWQALLATVSAAYEANSLSGNAGFTSPTDLHLLPCSAGFANGRAVAGIVDDIDGDARPQLTLPSRGADEVVLVGPCAGLAVDSATGDRPLTVVFSDLSQTSAPGGIIGWAWDFQGDGFVDSTQQNPTWTYTRPGLYSVVLTVQDANGTIASTIQPNLINVTAPQLTLSTPTPGSGILTIDPVPGLNIPGAWRGFTFLSFDTGSPVGSGGWFGLEPDVLTLVTSLVAVSPGNIFHYYVTPGLYPASGQIAAGPYPWLAGLSLDGVQVFFDTQNQILEVSNVSRVTL